MDGAERVLTQRELPMSDYVAMPTVLYDTQVVRSGQRESIFFGDRLGPAVDETTRKEPELVDWVMSKPMRRDRISEVLGMPSQALFRSCVTGPFIKDRSRKPGDLDLIVVDPLRPQEAVVIEFKRIKVTAGRGDHQAINDRALKKAPAQVEGLLELGFFRTFFGVVTIVSDYHDRDSNFAARGTTASTLNKIRRSVGSLDLHPDVGFVCVESVQPVADTLDNAAAISAYEFKAAQPRPQAGELTTLVDRCARDWA